MKRNQLTFFESSTFENGKTFFDLDGHFFHRNKFSIHHVGWDAFSNNA